MLRSPFVYVFVCIVLVLTAAGCRSPLLEIKNEQITAFDRAARTLTWTATVENVAERDGLFCSPGSTEDYGQVTLQAYLVTESDLENPQHALAAAGVMIPTLGVPLGIGESKTTTQSPGPFARSIDAYTHLLLTAYAANADRSWSSIVAARASDESCKRLITTVLIPLP